MIFRKYHILYTVSVHYKHRSGQSKKECPDLVLSKKQSKIHILIILIVDYLLTPSVSMFIDQGLSLEACHASQAERRSANTATAPTSVAAAVAAASTAAAAAAAAVAAAATERRLGFVSVSAITRSLPTCRNGFHCLSTNRRTRRWSVLC